MRPARSNHGEPGYARKHKCDCEPCCKARARYAKELAFDQHRGQSRRYDARPIREHVQQLLDAGATYVSIANATDGKVVSTQVRRLVEGSKTGKPVTYLFRPACEALMAVTKEQCVGKGYRDSIGVHRRIQALHALGFTALHIGKELGVTESEVHNYLGRNLCSEKVWLSVKAVYDRLSVQRGTSARMLWKARRMGWPPPLAWDDDKIDDRTVRPDLKAVLCIVEGCPSSVTRRSLCVSHYKALSQRGGLRSPSRYREVALSLKARPVHVNDKKVLLYELSDLKARGYSPEQAALELARGVEYVKKVWREAS